MRSTNDRPIAGPEHHTIMRGSMLYLGLSALLFHASCRSGHEEPETEARFLATAALLRDTVTMKDLSLIHI